MQISEVMSAHGHEQVVFVAEPKVGMRAVIAIHSTALGPSLGGIRFWNYPDEGAAIERAVRPRRGAAGGREVVGHQRASGLWG